MMTSIPDILTRRSGCSQCNCQKFVRRIRHADGLATSLIEFSLTGADTCKCGHKFCAHTFVLNDDVERWDNYRRLRGGCVSTSCVAFFSLDNLYSPGSQCVCGADYSAHIAQLPAHVRGEDGLGFIEISNNKPVATPKASRSHTAAPQTAPSQAAASTNVNNYSTQPEASSSSSTRYNPFESGGSSTPANRTTALMDSMRDIRTRASDEIEEAKNRSPTQNASKSRSKSMKIMNDKRAAARKNHPYPSGRGQDVQGEQTELSVRVAVVPCASKPMYDSRIDVIPALKLQQRHANKLVARLSSCGLTVDVVVPKEGSVVPALQQALCELLEANQLFVDNAPRSSLSPIANFDDVWWQPLQGRNMGGVRTLSSNFQEVHDGFTSAIVMKLAQFQCEDMSKKLVFVGSRFGRIFGPIANVVQGDQRRIMALEDSPEKSTLLAELGAPDHSHHDRHPCFAKRVLAGFVGETSDMDFVEDVASAFSTSCDEDCPTTRRATPPFFVRGDSPDINTPTPSGSSRAFQASSFTSSAPVIATRPPLASQPPIQVKQHTRPTKKPKKTSNSNTSSVRSSAKPGVSIPAGSRSVSHTGTTSQMQLDDVQASSSRQRLSSQLSPVQDGRKVKRKLDQATAQPLETPAVAEPQVPVTASTSVTTSEYMSQEEVDALVDMVAEPEVASIEDLKAWAFTVKPSDNDLVTRVTARFHGRSEGDIAQGIIDKFLKEELQAVSMSLSREFELNLARDVEIPDLVFFNLIDQKALFSIRMDSGDITSGRAVGEAVFQEIMKRVLSDRRIWVSEGAQLFVTPFDNSYVDATLHVKCKVYAMLIAAYICRFNEWPVDLSPLMMLLFILDFHGFRDAHATTYLPIEAICRFDRRSAARLASWHRVKNNDEDPLFTGEGQALPRTDPLYELCIQVTKVDLKKICKPLHKKPMAKDHFTRQLQSWVLFGVNDYTSSPNVKHFVQGLSVPIAGDVSFLKSFGSVEDATPLLMAMVAREVKDPEKIIEAVSFHHNAPDRTMNRLDYLFGFLLECRVYEWLRGRGFVDHDAVRAYMSPGEFEKASDDPSARARLLLAGVAQSSVPPVWDLNISITVKHLDSPADILNGLRCPTDMTAFTSPSAFQTGACGYSLTVPLSNCLRESLLVRPTPGMITLFEVWWTCGLAMRQGFNTL
ncbi:hypothetical protein SCHPADRAFT_641259 [Schizopora paradoxa]|uniref:Uncharacterized protein n=1 Tax=Schizopora paradoxa TaxID=27342 RepID=A0A0H2RDK3_9AGAM|nr:hypothetical protein SCHPADRAFT_641259 [Schizopora paradoxa]